MVTEKWSYENSVCKGSINGKAASPVELLKHSIRRAWTINGLFNTLLVILYIYNRGIELSQENLYIKLLMSLSLMFNLITSDIFNRISLYSR